MKNLTIALLIAAMAFLELFSLSARADGKETNRYVIGTANDEFGLFPFPPWDVIDPLTGENVGLDGQFIRAIDAANIRMKIELRGVPYSDCGALSDPFFLGSGLAKGDLDGCSTWGQTTRRAQAGATFGPAVQSSRFDPVGVLVRNANAAPLPDSNDALVALGAGDIGVVGGFLADVACLQKHYPESSSVRAKTAIGSEEEVLAWVSSGEKPYAWLVRTESGFPPPNTVLAHDPAGAVKNGGAVCAGPFALMINEWSQKRKNKSALLKRDAFCGVSLIAASSELAAGEDLSLPDASTSSVSNTDFQDIACGKPVPTPSGTYQDFRDLCALDSEIPLPSLQCLEGQLTHGRREGDG